jgi:hypothetical protein
MQLACLCGSPSLHVLGLDNFRGFPEKNFSHPVGGTEAELVLKILFRIEMEASSSSSYVDKLCKIRGNVESFERLLSGRIDADGEETERHRAKIMEFTRGARYKDKLSRFVNLVIFFLRYSSSLVRHPIAARIESSLFLRICPFSRKPRVSRIVSSRACPSTRRNCAISPFRRTWTPPLKPMLPHRRHPSPHPHPSASALPMLSSRASPTCQRRRSSDRAPPTCLTQGPTQRYCGMTAWCSSHDTSS